MYVIQTLVIWDLVRNSVYACIVSVTVFMHGHLDAIISNSIVENFSITPRLFYSGKPTQAGSLTQQQAVSAAVPRSGYYRSPYDD